MTLRRLGSAPASSSTSPQSGERALLLLFGIAYGLALLEQGFRWVDIAGRRFESELDFGLSEWLINYAGGFQRRGLSGAALHAMAERFGWHPGALIVGVSLLLYGLFAIYLWRSSSAMLPRWALLTTPLLGYPVFMDWVMVRKDFLLLLLFAVSIHLLCHGCAAWARPVAALSLAIGVLSYELIAVLALPAAALLLLLPPQACAVAPAATGFAGGDGQPLASRRGPRPAALLWLLPPVAALIAVLIRRGTLERSWAIVRSWRFWYREGAGFEALPGAIGWLHLPSERYIQDSQMVLAQSHHGLPMWLILLLASLSGLLLLASALARRSAIRATFFCVCGLLQFTLMLPVFYHSWDHGRWVVLCLQTAMVLAIEIPLAWQQRCLAAFALPWSAPAARWSWGPGWLAPLGLGFWGLKVVFWSPYAWLSAAPVGVLLELYFQLRLRGWSPDLQP